MMRLTKTQFEWLDALIDGTVVRERSVSLAALARKGLVQWVRSGEKYGRNGYRITDEGRKAHHEHKRND